MVESDMLHTLDVMVEKVIQHIREDSANVEFRNIDTKYFVRSHGDYYDICEKGTDIIKYGNIIDIDFARAIMYSLVKYNSKYIGDILSLENQYAKHINDMLFYVNAYKNSKDAIVREVAVDRFEMSKGGALEVKKKLRVATSILDK